MQMKKFINDPENLTAELLEGLALANPDILELGLDCKFNDCAHESEPGCAVRAAVDDGRLDRGRFESYRKLEREIAFEERREDPIAQRAERDRWKAVHVAYRKNPKPGRD